MTEGRDQHGKWSTWVRWLGTLLAVVLLVWLLEQQDWDLLLEAAGSAGWQILLLSLGFVAVRQLLNVLRWYVLLLTQPIHLNYAQAFRLTFAGLFASNFLPTTVGGDVVRLVGVMEASEDRFEASTTIAMDRLVGLTGMLLLVPFGLPILSGMLGAIVWVGSLVAVGGARVLEAMRRAWDRLGQVVGMWRDRPRAIFASLLVNLTAIAAYLTAVWLLAVSMGIAVTYLEVAGATSITYFLTLLPLSVNGYGLRELGVVAVYTHLGATPEQASALALITRGLLWAVSLAGMLWVSEVLESAGQQIADVGWGTEPDG